MKKKICVLLAFMLLCCTLLQARKWTAEQSANADVNGDGKVNAVDARWILQMASGARILAA